MDQSTVQPLAYLLHKSTRIQYFCHGAWLMLSLANDDVFSTTIGIQFQTASETHNVWLKADHYYYCKASLGCLNY